MSLKKILLSAVLVFGATSSSTFALEMDASRKQYCEETCTKNHCSQFPNRYYSCRGECGDPYAAACESGVKDSNLVDQAKQAVPLIVFDN